MVAPSAAIRLLAVCQVSVIIAVVWTCEPLGQCKLYGTRIVKVLVATRKATAHRGALHATVRALHYTTTTYSLTTAAGGGGERE